MSRNIPTSTKLFPALFYDNKGTAERNKWKKRCAYCLYGCVNIGELGCDYWADEGKKRPCPCESKTNRCTAFVPLNGKRNRQRALRANPYYNDGTGRNQKIK